MSVIRILIPGSFEDAYLYMQHLVLLTEERKLRFVRLESLVAALEYALPSSEGIARLLFERNDWLATQQVGELLRNSGISRAFSAPFARLQEPLVIESSSLTWEEGAVHVPAEVLLDMRIYNARLYVAADTGLYDADLDWDYPSARLDEPFRKRLDARSLGLATKYGTVSVSCEEAGLFAGFDEFGWLGRDLGHQLRRIAARSVRSDWLGTSIVNFPSPRDAVLLPMSYERVATSDQSFDRGERRMTVVVDLATSEIGLENFYTTLGERFGVSESSVSYSWHVGATFFANTLDGRTFSADVRQRQTDRPGFARARTYKWARDRIISAEPMKLIEGAGCFLAEAEERVLLLSDAGTETIYEGDVISLRTFPGSRRYQCLGVLIVDEGVMLVAASAHGRRRRTQRS